MALDPKKNAEIWLSYANQQKELLEGKVKDDIEKHRKGWCKIRFVDRVGNPIVGKKVSVCQKTHEFKYGANIFMLDEFTDEKLNEAYRDNFSKYFNLATVPFYWDGLEPEEGKPRFAKNSPKVYRRPAPELCVEYCEEKGIAAKLHCLVYDKFIPEWLKRDDMAYMEKAYEERIRQIAERYNGRLYEIEVINELLCEPGWNYKSAISSKRDIIEWSFALARKYMPNEKLVINEGMGRINEYPRHRYRQPYFMMTDLALKNGASIDKVGIQHHCFSGATTITDEAYEREIGSGINSEMFDPAAIIRGFEILSQLGKPMEMTEITVPTFGSTAEDEKLQAELLDVLYTAAFSVKELENVVYWNVPDGYAYQPEGRNWNENNCRGGLFRKDMTPKASAERLYEMFNKRWHTELCLETDEGGYVEFRGFYGGYTAELCDEVAEFDIIKGESNSIIVEI
ncbi:MAG: hypothetical protein E7656_05500 [Ruminococcaceae bacterium]|nr:hypothetical protein [Oscillospiraceae bacterium]